jgi:thymidylate kinase
MKLKAPPKDGEYTPEGIDGSGHTSACTALDAQGAASRMKV